MRTAFRSRLERLERLESAADSGEIRWALDMLREGSPIDGIRPRSEAMARKLDDLRTLARANV